jgi:hypothetical protein
MSNPNDEFKTLRNLKELIEKLMKLQEFCVTKLLQVSAANLNKRSRGDDVKSSVSLEFDVPTVTMVINSFLEQVHDEVHALDVSLQGVRLDSDQDDGDSDK